MGTTVVALVASIRTLTVLWQGIGNELDKNTRSQKIMLVHMNVDGRIQVQQRCQIKLLKLYRLDPAKFKMF